MNVRLKVNIAVKKFDAFVEPGPSLMDRVLSSGRLFSKLVTHKTAFGSTNRLSHVVGLGRAFFRNRVSVLFAIVTFS